MRPTLLLIVSSLLLAACGSKGPLFLPQDAPQQDQAQQVPQATDEQSNEKKEDDEQ